MRNWVNHLIDNYRDRILAFDQATAEQWAILSAAARQQGQPLPVVDGYIAATAVQHNLTVVTRNTADFTATQVPLFNPWAA